MGFAPAVPYKCYLNWRKNGTLRREVLARRCAERLVKTGFRVAAAGVGINASKEGFGDDDDVKVVFPRTSFFGKGNELIDLTVDEATR